MPRAIVQLAPGKPEVLALKFAKGRDYGERVLFSTVDERVLYLDQEEARELEALGIPKEVPFSITRVRTGKGGTRCEFARLNGAAEKAAAPNGSARVPQAHDTPVYPEVPAVSSLGSPDLTGRITPVAAKLLASYMTAVDTLLETQVYAQRKGLVIAITCEDVRCLAATVFISAEGGSR